MSKAIVNTFKKLDTDTSQNKQDPSSFYDAQDLRLISDEPLSNGALVNYKGTKAKIDLDSPLNKVVGYAEVGSELVLLCYNSSSEPYSFIASVSLSESNELQSITILYSDINSINKLGFAGVDYVETIGRYENEFSKKIYFAVPEQPLRIFNTYHNELSVLPSTVDVSNLDIIPNNSGSIISIDSIIQGGKLEAGKIQYACKLFNKYGAETTFSPCSELISLTSDNYNGSNEFKGSDIEVNSGKSVKINISLPNLDFNYIHIYSIHYKVKDTPVISLVGEVSVMSNTFSFIDNGTILDSVTLEEFNIFGGSLISAKAIGTKNNILFAANTKEISDTIDLDCRAYRYSNNVETIEETDISISSWTSSEITFSSIYHRVRIGWIYLDLPGSVAANYYKVKSITLDGLTITILHNNITQQGGTLDILHDDYRQSYLYQSDNSYYILDSNGRWVYKDSSNVSISWGDNDVSIPLDSDCINKYNDEFLKLSGNSIHPYTYDKKSDGITIGGTGKIVSYEIKTDADYTTLVDNGETIVNSSNINFILKETSLKQGETYRFGLTAYDLKGKPYFANWIGDIRIPYFNDSNNIFTSTAYSNNLSITDNIKIDSKNIYIEFSIDVNSIDYHYPGTLDKISGFEIVKVQRNISDRSVVAQGCSVGGVVLDNAVSNAFIPRCLPAPHTLTDTYPSGNIDYIHTFYSPEFNINGGIDTGGKYRLHVTKILVSPRVREVEAGGFSSSFEPAALPTDVASKVLYPITRAIDYTGAEISRDFTSLSGAPSITRGFSFDIIDGYKISIVEKNGNKIVLSANNQNVSFLNRVNSDTSMGHTMYGQTGVIFSSNTILPVKANPGGGIGSGYVYILDLYVDNFDSRYGGNTYQSRTLNEYEKCSEFVLKPNLLSTISINGYGDTYNTIWDTITSGADPNIDDGGTSDSISGTNVNRRQIVALLPLESSINCMLTGSKPSKYIVAYPSGKNKDSKYIGLAETELKGISIWGDKYPKVGDFNSYNTAYSSTSKYPTFFPEPNLFDISTEKNNFIYASEKKINGEYIDSWSKFLYANGLEVEGIYGAIHKLTTLDNKLYFFQEEAIGVAAVNDRYIIGAGDATKLSLGVGTVLERFDYVKYNEGIIKPEHVINTVTNLYFIDHNRKVIDIIGNSDIALSIEKGINTLFRYLYKDSNTYVTIGFDPVFREVYFNINNGADKTNKTLVYNENINTFQPRSSARPDLFLSISDGMLSFKQSNDIPDIKNYIYKHNAGDIGELYSEASYINNTTNLHPRWDDSGDVTIFGTDRFKFNAIPSGYRNELGEYGYIGTANYLVASDSIDGANITILRSEGSGSDCAVIYDGGSFNNGSPVRAVRHATSEEQLLPDGLISATYTDIDGNVYNCTKIGLQVWTTKNLKVTKYADGTAIPTNLSDAAWAADTVGACAVYGKNDGAFVPVDELITEALMVAAYGRLYNWYAVNNAHGLIDTTTGFNIPSDTDFTQLINYLITIPGITIDNVGDVLKSTRQVNSPLVEKIYSDSYVSILVNTNSTNVFVADNVEFRTEVRDYNEDNSIFSDLATYTPIQDSTLKTGAIGDVLKTVDSIEFKNGYQNVLRNTVIKHDYRDAIPGVIPNTSRRHRSWTTAVPMFIDPTTGNSTRFVDTFLSMKFTFNNRDNKVFKLHDITTYIRPTHK